MAPQRNRRKRQAPRRSEDLHALNKASIASQNARLLRADRTKTKHLALLSNVSRLIITMLNPDEMLAKIAEELEQGLDYSHIGIGLLDYSNKEIVIQAEAGHRKGALGRRLGLDGNVVGRVARIGQMAVVTYQNSEEASGEPVLEGSVSAIVLPIVYADQLHGVLYVETDRNAEFPQEEILFLGTLADLISGALHNALTFQKAQEQAITDSLTGVWNRHFFDEEVWVEWKRSIRIGRPFSLVFIDLDHFKFVNDAYGHMVGDLVLQRVANILRQNCRPSDVVARYGGDEFVILMPGLDAYHAGEPAAKLRFALTADELLERKNVTGSFGVASYPLHGTSPTDILETANGQMYVSKHAGGNRVSRPE